jgi:hypothetical protein
MRSLVGGLVRWWASTAGADRRALDQDRADLRGREGSDDLQTGGVQRELTRSGLLIACPLSHHAARP